MLSTRTGSVLRMGSIVTGAIALMAFAIDTATAAPTVLATWDGEGVHWTETLVTLEEGVTYRFQGLCTDRSGHGIGYIHEFHLKVIDDQTPGAFGDDNFYWDCLNLNNVYTPAYTSQYKLVFHVHTDTLDILQYSFAHQLTISREDGPLPSATPRVVEPSPTPEYTPQPTQTALPPSPTPTTAGSVATATASSPAPTSTAPAATASPTNPATNGVLTENRLYLPVLLSRDL